MPLLFNEEGNALPTSASGPSPLSGNNNGNGNNRGGGGGGEGGSLLRTFLLGGSSALVASPCATPVLTSVLAYVASSRDPTLGSALLFTYTAGYSTPLLAAGAAGGQALARASSPRAKSEEANDDDSWRRRLGGLVTPATAAFLIWYGTGSLLEAAFGNPSLAGLAPVLD